MPRIILSLFFLVAVAYTSFSQSVAVNTDGSAPSASAMLDIKSSNKGFLPPRIELDSIKDVTTITTPATGLLVYNTNAVTTVANGLTGPGYYYYNGARWVPCGMDNRQLFLGTWTVKNIEQELYSGNTFTGKMFTNPTGSTFTFNANGTYVSVYQANPPENGTWELVSATYLVIDKSTVKERHYHILTLDNKNLIFRGPFDANGRIITSLNYVLTNYYGKQ